MIDPRGNPEVNSNVISDFLSNSDHAPYASTTEDLLDRIRNSVDAIVSVAAGAPLSFKQICSRWIIVEVGGLLYSSFANVVFRINNVGLLDPVGFILSDTILYFDNSFSLELVLEKPFILSKIGRLSGDLLTDVNFNAYGSLNMTTARNLLIDYEEQNIFSLEVVVLPDTILNNDVNDNYFEVEINGVARKYFLDSFNGIPIINRILLEDFGNIQNIRITPNTGIILEYTIKHTYPNLP